MSALKTNTFYSLKVNQYYLSLIKEAWQTWRHRSLTALSCAPFKLFANKGPKKCYENSVFLSVTCMCSICVCILAQTRKLWEIFHKNKACRNIGQLGVFGSFMPGCPHRPRPHTSDVPLHMWGGILSHCWKKKSIFSKVPTLTSADIDGKQPNQCSLSMAAAWNVGRAAPHLIPYYPSDGAAAGRLRMHKGAMTAPRVWGCVGTCARVCGPCVCIHFLPVCFAPSTLPQIPHPNHNYNVISRVRQCPRCCFTLSFSPLLWISNAVTLSSKSCTARSQTGVWHVCFYRLGWGCALFDSTFLQFLTVQARKRGLTIARVY